MTVQTGGINVTGSVTSTGLTVNGDGVIQDATPTLEFKDTDNNLIASVGGASGSLLLKADTGGGTSGESMQFHTGGSEVARFDSSGSLFISSTSDSGSNRHFFQHDGFFRHVRSGQIVGVFDRLSTDGNIVHFRKDGSDVGVIGTDATDIYIGTTDTGIRFNDAVNGVLPYNTSTGQTDATLDLGFSTVRWKDLYLSNIAHIGNEVTFKNSANSSGFDIGLLGGSSDATAFIFQRANDSLQFGTNNIERARISSTGDLLVGNTVTNPSSNFSNQRGFAYVNSTGKVEIATTADDVVMDIGKNNANDGSIVVFRKQGTVVGSIGTLGGQSYIHGAGTDTGLYWGSNNIYPYRSTGLNDATIDIGHSSYRFKDLHLSGTANAPLLITNDIKATGSGGMSFQTDEGTKRLEISDAGNVNIFNGSLMLGSTALPTAKVDIRVPTSASVVTAINLDASGNNNGDGTAINFSRGSNLLSSIAKIEAVKTEVSNNETDLVFSNYAAGSLTEKMRLVGATGKAIFSGTLQSEKLIITDYGAPALKIIPDPAFSTEPEHDLIYTGYQSNLQDYLSIKAAGNSSQFHGVLAISDVGIYFGRTHVETGSPVGNSATSPFDAGNYGYINNTGLTVNGTISSSAITSTGLTVNDGTNGSVQFGTSNTRRIAAGADYSGFRFYSDSSHGFYTNNVERFKIGSTGNVNINSSLMVGSTTAPARGLQIHKEGNHLSLTTTASGTAAGNGSDFKVDASSSDLQILNYESANTTFWTSGTQRLLIDSSGRVGINRTSPSGLLHMQSPSGTDSALYIQTSAATDDSVIHFGDDGASSVGSILYDHSTNSMQFETNSSERMRIDSSGRVGIGTALPNQWASYTDSAATVLQVQDTSQRARLVINGGNGAHLDLVDYAGGTNDKHMNIAVDGGILKFGSLNDAGSAFVQNNILVMDLGTGNCGLGTTSPSSLLHLVGTSAKARIQDSSNNFAIDLQMSSSVGKISTSDDMALRPGGVESVRLKSNGRVGIGTTSPSNLLDCTGSISNDYVAAFENTNATNGYGVLAKTAHTGTSAFAFGAYGGSNALMVVRGDGQVAIGTVNPNSYTNQRVLTINGTTHSRIDFETGSTLRASVYGDSGSLNIDALGNFTRFYTGNTERMRIDSSGRVLINNGVNLSFADADDLQVGNTTGAHGITIISSSSHNGNLFFGDNAHNDSGSIRYNHTNDRMEFFTNRTSQVIIDSSGHLGISTTNPTQYINTGNFF